MRGAPVARHLLAAAFLFLACSGALAETRVFIQNNTIHSLSVSNRSITQPNRHPLPVGSFNWNTRRLPAGERTRLVSFPRASGVRNGEDYTFNSEISLGQDQVLLRQRVHGTLLHSRLSYATGPGSLQRGRAWKYFEWDTSQGKIEVLYRSYFTGGDDDIEYVFNYVFPGNPPQDTLNLLAYNVYLRPTTLFANGQTTRADLIPARLEDYDVIVFSEAFDDEVRALLQARLVNEYPHFTRILGSDEGFEQDGGVFIASRWAIEAEDQLEFEEQSLVDFGGNVDLCGGWDCQAEKGVVYARIGKEERTYHIFGTHTQAGAEPRHADIRSRQFRILRAFIDSKNIPSGDAVIIAGDLNADRTGPEYQNMLSTLNAVHPPTRGYTHTVDPGINTLSGGNQRKYLDYVLHTRDHLQPVAAFNEVRLVRSRFPWKDFFWESETWELSDHFPVYGQLQYGRPAFMIAPPSLDLGAVLRDTTATRDRSLTVSSVGTGPVTIQRVQLEGPQFLSFGLRTHAQSGFPLDLPPGDEFQITVDFRSAVQGRHEARVVVRGLDINRSSVEARAVLTANVVAAQLSVLPAAINFGLVTVGQQPVRNVLIDNPGTADLRYRVRPPGAGPFTWTGDPGNAWQVMAPGNSRIVSVRYQPTAVAAHTGQLRIEGEDGAAAVDLFGEGVPALSPAIHVRPSTVTFGIVAIGAGYTREVVIENSGQGTLTITDLRITGSGEFSMAPPSLPLDIPPLGRHRVPVTLSPSRSGEHRADFEVISNAPGGAVSVSLFGRAP